MIGNNLIAVMVGFVGVGSIVVGVKQGGGRVFRRSVLWVFRCGCNQNVGCGVIFFVVIIFVISIGMVIEGWWLIIVGSCRVVVIVGEIVVVVRRESVVREGVLGGVVL